ncbi:S28 family serine protease [Neolewinella persica]|uniref:S28 family serine protease n=1 Tax=Neolewinella persica TaxID=70998 RepID=UPI0003693D9A|nr:S28 family serine protease [Neolewinella persica]
MKTKALLFLALLFLVGTGVRAQTSFEQQLLGLPDLQTARKVAGQNGEMVYELFFRQPLDHGDTTQGFFQQKVFLTHRGTNQPTVIVTEGYTAPRPAYYELSDLLGANQLRVEHRYFGDSQPEGDGFDYLNLKQATADYHHLREIFADLYPGNWVSTGISKGGATTVFYRYFFPQDVSVSVPYVAPINREYEEQRIYDFLDNVGTPECRARIKALQTRLLANEAEVLSLLRFYNLGKGDNYTYKYYGEAFELGVLEYPFAFWQWGGDCDAIPDERTSLEGALEYFLEVAGIDLFSDQLIDFYAAHYYQAATEMGYYGYRTSRFKELLKFLPTDKNVMAILSPKPLEAKFDGKLLKEVDRWLKKEGNQIAYIYGANDTWTATAVQPNEKVDAEWFIMEGKSHGDARIKNMTEADRVRLLAALERWLE